MPSLDRSFTFSSRPRKFQTTHTDVQHTARLQRKQSRSSSRRPGDGYPTPRGEGYHPWHTAPNSHCNGGLKNAVDSVKDRLTQKLWVGTLGNSTDGFGPDLRDSINLRMRQLCASVPVWIPDAEFESCYDEFCHQVRGALASPSTTADLRDQGALALSALCSSRCPQDETVLRERSVQAIHGRQQALCRGHHRKLPRRRHRSDPLSNSLMPAHPVSQFG